MQAPSATKCKHHVLDYNKYCKVMMLRIAVIVKIGTQIFGPRPLSSEQEREREWNEKMARIYVQNADVLEDGNLQRKMCKRWNQKNKKNCAPFFTNTPIRNIVIMQYLLLLPMQFHLYFMFDCLVSAMFGSLFKLIYAYCFHWLMIIFTGMK